jgi:hypothetical protein
MAERSGGSVSYIDVSPAELAALKPSRPDVLNQFVASPELASGRKSLDQPSSTAILVFKNRAEQAVAGAALREVAQQSPTSGVNIDMPNLETMQSAFDDINTQMKVVEDTLPVELLPQVEIVRKKMEVTQRDMLDAQKNIERKRGAVEGGRYVEAVPTDIGGFISEKRGETIRYSYLKDDGEIGKVAFVDNGKKVEVHDWKDRDALLAAMQLSSEKWGNLTVTGTNSYKALVVQLAAEHGFQIANPELQGHLLRETARLERMKEARPGFVVGNIEKAELTSQETVTPLPQAPQVPAAEAPASEAADQIKPQSWAFTDTGALVKIHDRTDREAVRAAMQEASKKWGEISVTGTARDKDQAVSVAAEHGYKLANPELQEKLQQEKLRIRNDLSKIAYNEASNLVTDRHNTILKMQEIEKQNDINISEARKMTPFDSTPSQIPAEVEYRDIEKQKFDKENSTTQKRTHRQKQ